MTKMHELVAVAAPLSQAASRLDEFFRVHGSEGGDMARLTLRLALNVPGLGSPLSIERDVIATIAPAHKPEDMTPRYRVQWAPETPGPYPLFAGELRVGAADDYDAFYLILDGSYEPPLGIAGGAFDALAGKYIAQQTALDLLSNVKSFIETAFARNEAGKAGASAPAQS